jgi:hypothetical protein
MQKKFKVGKIVYVANFENSEFEFYIDSKESDNTLWLDKDSFDYKFGDLPPDRVYGFFPSENPMAVLSNMMKFVESAIKSKAPFFFFFEANCVEKEGVYDKIAKRIANKYGYFLSEERAFRKKYMFYKR